MTPDEALERARFDRAFADRRMIAFYYACGRIDSGDPGDGLLIGGEVFEQFVIDFASMDGSRPSVQGAWNDMVKTLRYVRIDRPDGSRTYKGPGTETWAEREYAAWADSFGPEYRISIRSYHDAREDVIRFSKATTNSDATGNRYIPTAEHGGAR